MLHTKFCVNRSASSGEEDSEWLLPYMGVAAILVMLHINFHFDWPNGSREEYL